MRRFILHCCLLPAPLHCSAPFSRGSEARHLYSISSDTGKEQPSLYLVLKLSLFHLIVLPTYSQMPQPMQKASLLFFINQPDVLHWLLLLPKIFYSGVSHKCFVYSVIKLSTGWTPEKPKQNKTKTSKRHIKQGAWMAHLVKCLTLDSGSGHDLTVVSLSPALGSALSVEPA